MTTKIMPASRLDEKYTLSQGQAFMSGTQALVKLPMLQKQLDQRHGLNTAGFISGYRGSPLAGLDQQLWKAKAYLEQHNIIFQAGLNEDLAATAVWGTQQVNLFAGAQYQGVFGLWYGKGPGVDRSMDVFKHANAAGTDQYGGVLLVVGDDHGAKSSSVAHQSEHVLMAAGIPVLYPSNVQEILDFGLHGWAMSRYSGLWVGLKCVTQIVETSASVAIDLDRTQIVLPDDFAMPEGGLNIRWPDPPLVQEARMLNHKWYSALAYIRANQLNQITIDTPNARFGIMSAGKAYQDVCQALQDLGLDKSTLQQLGVRVMKVGCVWPLDAQNARHFAEGLEEILVVEEKRQILEYALKEELYNWRENVRPKVYGKFNARENSGGEWSVPRSEWLLPAAAELSPSVVAKAIVARLFNMALPEPIRQHMTERMAIITQKQQESLRPSVTRERQPWFCSGCPHNISTQLPAGSRAVAGIGCHYMVQWMDRNTKTFSHMGGEGVSWLGQMHFTTEQHVFVNLGDGTYFHSGLLAIRAAVSAKANMTYKILYNHAIAMTGGQPLDGELTVPQLAHQVLAEGVVRTVIVSDAPEQYQAPALQAALPQGVDIYHRNELDKVQRLLRDTAGTSVLIYEQMCATEKRRHRKRGQLPVLEKRTMINSAVCEGCGDCSKVSNCLSIEPLETTFGTKRFINQSSCNQDFSCVRGFCPSFVTLEGAMLRPPIKANMTSLEQHPAHTLPKPVIPDLTQPYRILITGVGGTGVVTVGALIGMAAHLARKAATVLDMTGLAQKGGAVISHVQLADSADKLHASRISTAEANLILGCDSIVSSSKEALSCALTGFTKAIINSHATPTAEWVLNREWHFPNESIQQDLHAALGEACEWVDANAIALQLLGNTIYTNAILIGYAWQKGWIPLQEAHLLDAIHLNGEQVVANQQAFYWGRYIAEEGVAAVQMPVVDGNAPATNATAPESAELIIEQYAQHLEAYQNKAYAQRYQQILKPLQQREEYLSSDANDLPITCIAAKQLGKLMSYKDEYEVARLYSQADFMAQLRQQFAGEPGKDYQIKFHFSLPFLSGKREYGQWLLRFLPLLARLKILRGTRWDGFAYTTERRKERELIAIYTQLITQASQQLTADNQAKIKTVLAAAEAIKGFGAIKMAAIAHFQQQCRDYLGEDGF